MEKNITILKNFKVCRKYILIVGLLVFFIVVGVLSYQRWRMSEEEIPDIIFKEDELWDRNFDELVAGYVVLQKVEGISEIFGYINQTNAYFKIIDYKNDKFIKNIEEKISEGNTINIKNNGNILFNLGCLKDGEIVADGKNLDYINKESQEAILKSTEKNPIALVFHFEPELGRGCLCCSFASRVWVY